MQKQPNRWSCVPMAFSILTGIPIDEIIKAVGHDGSEILYPDLEEPYCYRGFHVLEITKVMFDRQIYFVPFFAELRSQNRYGKSEVRDFDVEPYLDHAGVILGRFWDHSHAAAYDPPFVYDPNGIKYELSKAQVKIYQFWILAHDSRGEGILI